MVKGIIETGKQEISFKQYAKIRDLSRIGFIRDTNLHSTILDRRSNYHAMIGKIHMVKSRIK